MSDKHTPTDQEAMRSYVRGRFHDSTTNPRGSIDGRRLFVPEWKRWLAERDREVAAKALTDAAHAMPDNIYDPRHVADWLRARAAALGTPEQEEEQ